MNLNNVSIKRRMNHDQQKYHKPSSRQKNLECTRMIPNCYQWLTCNEKEQVFNFLLNN